VVCDPRRRRLFVTRRKRNADCRELGVEIATAMASRPIAGSGSATTGRMAGRQKNPLFDVVLRELTVARPDKDEPLYLLTNDLNRPAAEIARLYEERWQIELLFKWLKQNLKIRRFLGRGENAGRTQIDLALIAFMLPRILNQTAARSFTDSTALLLTRLKLGLFGPFSRREHNTPPPKPPSLRPPNPQTCLVFQSTQSAAKSRQQCAKAGGGRRPTLVKLARVSF
jgi:putative transposase